MAAGFTIIDDQDPSIKYTGTWPVGGTVNEHAGTVTSSVKVGNHFSVPFTGTAIAVYGTYDSSSAGVQTSYAIDGGSPVTVTSPSSPNDSYQRLFWQSDSVSSGQHNLVVTMVSINGNGADGEGTVWFDYFNVTTVATTDTSNASNASGSSPSPSNTAAKSKGSSTGTSSSPSSTSSGVAVASSGKSHTSLIAGVVIAILIIALAVAGYLRRIRRARRYNNFAAPPNMSSTNGPPPTQPFLPDQTPITPMSGMPGSAPMAAYGSPAPSGAPYTPGVGGFDPRQTYATPAGAYGKPNAYAPVQAQGYPAQAPYDPYASAGAAAMQHPNNAAPQSSYAASVSSVPSSSQYPSSLPYRGPLSVVGGSSTVDSDSVAELKRRQQQVVNQYEQGVGGSGSGSAPVIQHTDSGVRALEPGAGPAPTELPPVYTPN